MFTPKTNIDKYIDNSELNSRIYDILLRLNDCETCEQHQLKREPLEIFNRAYAICDELQPAKYPELAALAIWERLLKNNYLVCETNIIFSCVYVILFFSETENKNMKHFLTLFKHILDKGYFKEFESSGFYGLYGNLMAVTLGSDLSGFGLGSIEEDETAMYNHLVRTRDVILAAPQIDHVLGILEDEEQKFLREVVIVYPYAITLSPSNYFVCRVNTYSYICDRNYMSNN